MKGSIMTENRTVSNGAMGSGKSTAMPENDFERAGAKDDCRLDSRDAFASERYSERTGGAFHNLRAERKRLHLLVKPTGWVSGMAMDNPGFQMKHSVKLLEEELAQAGEPRVLQLFLRGADSKDPDAWELFADGTMVASGSGDFARECFEQSATRFLELCREAVAANAAPSFSKQEYDLLQAAKHVAQVEARTVAREEGRLAALAVR